MHLALIFDIKAILSRNPIIFEPFGQCGRKILMSDKPISNVRLQGFPSLVTKNFLVRITKITLITGSKGLESS